MVQPTAPSLWAPVDAPHRVVTLDVLRGFAILGVLVANTLTFAYPMASSPPGAEAWRGTGWADRIAALLVGLLVEGKFYTLLSVLFGVGLAMQAGRAKAAGRPFGPFYLRRAAVLFSIGVLHGVLLYAGDILAFYAIVSVAALPFLKLPPRWLTAAALTSALLGVATLSLYAWSHPARPYPAPRDWSVPGEQLRQSLDPIERGAADVLERAGVQRQQFFDMMADEARIYRAGSWMEITRFRAITALLLLLPSKVLLLGLMVLAFFLCGMRLVRSPLFIQQDGATLAHCRSLLYAGVPSGLLLTVVAGGVPAMLPHSAFFAPSLYWAGTFGGVLLQSLGYCGGLLLVCARHPRGIVVRALSAVGRTALSNYILQSVVLGLVFYGNGLGLVTRLTALPVVTLAVPVFALETWLSLAWLRWHAMGPVEWMWRSLAYGRPLPLRREAPGAAGGL